MIVTDKNRKSVLRKLDALISLEKLTATGLSLQRAAIQIGISAPTLCRWRLAHRYEGEAGLTSKKAVVTRLEKGAL